MLNNLKSVLVTGASGGVGQVTVARLDKLGWRVFAGVRSLEAGERLARGRRNIVPIELDISTGTSIASAQERITHALHGHGLDALVNNAGLSVDGPLELIPVDRLREQFEVNVVGQLAVVQAFLPLLRLARGRIVNIGGAAGRVTLPMLGALSASKAALDAASDGLRMELKYQGVAVSYVEPGALSTELFVKSARRVEVEGFAGTRREQSRYDTAIAKAGEAMAKQKATPAEDAAVVISKALTARRPKARYVVGREARYVLPVVRRMPVRLRDRAVLGSLGLTKRCFVSADSPASIDEQVRQPENS